MRARERGTFFAAAAAMKMRGDVRAFIAAAGATLAGVAVEQERDPRGRRDTKPAEKADADDAIASSSTATGSPIGRIAERTPIPMIFSVEAVERPRLLAIHSACGGQAVD